MIADLESFEIVTYEDSANHHRTPISEPLDLLTLYSPSAASPNDERDGRRYHGAPDHDVSCECCYYHGRAIDAVWVDKFREVPKRTGLKRVAHHEAYDPKSRQPGHGPPAGRG